MIERKPSFAVGDNVFATLEEAQKFELLLLLADLGETEAQKVSGEILNNKDRIVDILTTTGTSKPKARKINGGKKVRAPKTPATTEATS